MKTTTTTNIAIVDGRVDKAYPIASLDQAGITVDDVAGLLATAFFPLPQAQWLVPSADERFSPLRNHFGLNIEYALRHGNVDLRSDMRAVAVWAHAPNGYLPDSEPDYADRLEQGTGPYYDRFETFDDTLMAHHLPGVGHHYLMFVGVLPEFRGLGYGTTLLNLHHRRLDDDGMAAFLEAATPQNVTQYRRHDYTLCGTYDLPPDGPAMHRMWREPRGATDQSP
ncbi:ribosomal protein S18 acetylase RimI-like enzyme [Lentzea atacamensis]|uniref:Ribosomal protein S18 acetylase RimI-like enzyme n=1 Tax=Lentzea atacamensis TaxID=531938 RepID=A0ABX9DWJ5_9PSEU|nr:GNAT family N-acetyltransferase [Lentzea atacamensis]RAS59532.1 ribosomal protein S18 acetylase RimI-like enzyme [Lentzea atacamensis]